MKVTLRYFASVREAMGTGSETLDTSARTLAELRTALVARGDAGAQALAPGRAVRMALNQQMSDGAAALSEGCEVAFFPPVTGG
ncbi:molybdopterin converting factor subunit 1 [uncultured Rhodoferax sp.]|uniref:molybdopterin converting factor subunit 1 n=1 Tax=uncultured Rhodoferax sp. TaxID=223188 RepID=UPI0025DF2B19|nr:molybdopterin converting factor subunit 1 [uncultured Rhodoferax sp.]